jgi:oligoribonuclease (3'-5' exoribonuclease)
MTGAGLAKDDAIFSISASILSVFVIQKVQSDPFFLPKAQNEHLATGFKSFAFEVHSASKLASRRRSSASTEERIDVLSLLTRWFNCVNSAIVCKFPERIL